MEQNAYPSAKVPMLSVRPVSYAYRYCPRCRCEWPAKYDSCPQCVHWLGAQPLERTEWQVVPVVGRSSSAGRYGLIGASALILRLVTGLPPSEQKMEALAAVLTDVICSTCDGGAISGVPEHGWLAWTKLGLRRAFLQGREIEWRLIGALPQLEDVLQHQAGIRWGLWTDQYILSFSGSDHPDVEGMTAHAIFDFEPDQMLCVSEAVYQVNRRWENFVSVPHRLLNGDGIYGYRLISHKRPSALDHADVQSTSPFIGRNPQLLTIESCWRLRRGIKKLAIIAEAGAGKTRLIKEWLARHRDHRALTATFSLFGGRIESFASQLAELPSDRLDFDALIDAAVDRIRADGVDVLVFDDIHWAGNEGVEFIERLVAALSKFSILIIFASRPSGRASVDTLRPDAVLFLKPLSASTVTILARRLIPSASVADEAARRSGGNPLFVEHFAAWAAEANFKGGEAGPRTLHELITARIEHLAKVRIAEIRERLRWSRSWERQSVNIELDRLEIEIGLWLDRLETGDYADRVEAARHLVKLERLDYEIFIAGVLAGRPRFRSSRLREAIERLVVGSSDQILADLKRRLAKAAPTAKINILQEAQRAADVLFGDHNWAAAEQFYNLLSPAASSSGSDEIEQRRTTCRLHNREVIVDDSDIYNLSADTNLETTPSVNALNLPYVWAAIGRRRSCSEYFILCAKAAEDIGDRAMADWARRKAAQLTLTGGPQPKA